VKSFYPLFVATLSIVFFSCSNGQTQNAKTNLSANEFESKIKSLPSAFILDVRTPGEFLKDHLQNAKNFDWNGNNFENQIAMLDKAKPVLVYCLSGARSTSAANRMVSEGFKEVYQLDGGILKWRAANLPTTTENASTHTGINLQQFKELLNSGKLVLVDFYADWCEPCKLMSPYLDEISKNMANSVTLLRINADDNLSLCKELNIDALPVLKIYKNNSLVWENVGYVDEATVLKHLR